MCRSSVETAAGIMLDEDAEVEIEPMVLRCIEWSPNVCHNPVYVNYFAMLVLCCYFCNGVVFSFAVGWVRPSRLKPK
jgi:hypothetical protein